MVFKPFIMPERTLDKTNKIIELSKKCIIYIEHESLKNQNLKILKQYMNNTICDYIMSDLKLIISNTNEYLNKSKLGKNIYVNKYSEFDKTINNSFSNYFSVIISENELEVICKNVYTILNSFNSLDKSNYTLEISSMKSEILILNNKLKSLRKTEEENIARINKINEDKENKILIKRVIAWVFFFIWFSVMIYNCNG